MNTSAIAWLKGPETYREWKNTLVVWLLTQDLLSYAMPEDYQPTRFAPPEPLVLGDEASEAEKIEQHRRSEEIEMWHQNNYRVLQAMLTRMSGNVQRAFQREIDRRNSHDLFVAIEDRYTERGLRAITNATMELIEVVNGYHRTADDLINAFSHARNRLDDILQSSGKEVNGDTYYARLFLTHCYMSENFSAWADTIVDLEDADRFTLTELAARLKKDVRPVPTWRGAANGNSKSAKSSGSGGWCDLPGHSSGKRKHTRSNCWTLHPEQRPTRASRSTVTNNTSTTDWSENSSTSPRERDYSPYDSYDS